MYSLIKYLTTIDFSYVRADAVSVLVCLSLEDQMDNIFFGKEGVVKGLCKLFQHTRADLVLM